jgi:hypothetical protein
VLTRNQLAPGKLAPGGISYFMAPVGAFQDGDLVTVTPTEAAAKIFLYATIGEPPVGPDTPDTPKGAPLWTSQFADELNEPGEREIVVTPLLTADKTMMDQNLYIAVYCPPGSVASAFTIAFWDERGKFGIIPGLPDAASIAIFAVVACCACVISLVGVVFLVLRLGRSGKHKPKTPKHSKQDEEIHLRNMSMQHQMHMQNMGMGVGMMQDPHAQMQANDRAMQSARMTMATSDPGYVVSQSQSPSPYDQTQIMNPYGGGDAGGTYPSAMQHLQQQQQQQPTMHTFEAQQYAQQYGGQSDQMYGGDFGGNGGQTDVVPLW